MPGASGSWTPLEREDNVRPLYRPDDVDIESDVTSLPEVDFPDAPPDVVAQFKKPAALQEVDFPDAPPEIVAQFKKTATPAPASNLEEVEYPDAPPEIVAQFGLKTALQEVDYPDMPSEMAVKLGLKAPDSRPPTPESWQNVPPNPVQQPRGVQTRVSEAFQEAYKPILGDAVKQIAPDFAKEHPIISNLLQGAVSGSTLGALDKLMAGVTALPSAAAGAVAGVAEKNPQATFPVGLSRMEADRLQRDIDVWGKAAMFESGMGPAGALSHGRSVQIGDVGKQGLRDLRKQGQTAGSDGPAGVAQEPKPPASTPVADLQNRGALEAGGENLNTRDYGKRAPAAAGELGVNVGNIDPTLQYALRPPEVARTTLDAAQREKFADFSSENLQEFLTRTNNQQLKGQIQQELALREQATVPPAAPPPPPSPPVRANEVRPQISLERASTTGPSSNLWEVYDNRGNAIARVRATIEGDTARIDHIYAGNKNPTLYEGAEQQAVLREQRGALGPSVLREVLRQFREQNPEVKHIVGERVSGARTGGSYAVEGVGPEVGVTPREVIAQRRPDQTVGDVLRADRPAETLRAPIPEPAEPRALQSLGAAVNPPTPPVLPARQPWLAGVRAPLDRLLHSWKQTFQPEAISEAALKADPQFAKYAAARAGEHDRIVREGLARERQWNAVPEQDRVGFMIDVENGRPVRPEYQAQAQTYRRMLHEAYNLEQRWGSKAGYVEDYFPHLWERPRPGQAPIEEFFKNSIGPTGFQKARVIDMIEDGLAAGYRLKHTNPEAIVRERLIAGADMRARMELLDNLKGMGLAGKVEDQAAAGTFSRAGWQRINAPDRQAWMLAPDVLSLWKNGVQSHGLWSSQNLAGDAFRSWMALKNVWVPVKLALSAFHPLHVYHIHFSSSVSRAVDQAVAGNFTGALKSFGQSFTPYQATGKMGRAQWLLGENARTPEGKLAVKTMEEGGFSPMLSEQLRIDAGQKFAEALQAMHPFKTPYHGLRYAIQKLQAPIFEHWIPHLKTAAYLNDAAALLQRSPELLHDNIARGVALRAISKSIDSRFGEMFYGGLFWNRYVKDAGIGSFLSLGWNLGFVREFGGAALEMGTRPLGKVLPPSATRQQIRDSTNKIKFASIYLGTAALIGGVMTKMLSGEDPKESADYIFPKVGGVNPDGSPRRLTTMFYLREGPMLAKHIQEHGGGIGGVFAGGKDMLWNKLLFQPLKELYENRNYYGREVWDTNAPGYQQFAQALQHVFTEQTSPMAVTGARRAQETGGAPIETPLAYLGFGPAPKYAESSALQNRIGHLYREHVSPGAKPYEDPEVTHDQQSARSKLLLARQRGDPDEISVARRAAIDAGLKPLYLAKLGRVAGDQSMFKALPKQDQMAILKQTTPDERKRYWPFTKRETRVEWNRAHTTEGR